MIDATQEIHFPILEELHVEHYALYPGNLDATPGLRIDFRPGLTLVVGTNGLGKTTLVTILYRMMTGPFDIPGLSGQSELGGIELKPSALSASRRRILGQRVVDGAKDAVARLQFRLGDYVVTIKRRLSDFTLQHFSINGEHREPTEANYQATLPPLVGVWSFGDWILLLRYLVFYFEERRALVWDASAQRQVLRFLLLSPDTARKWTEDERAILELDSRFRNLSAVVTKETRALSQIEDDKESAPDVRAELESLGDLQLTDVDRRSQLLDALVEADDRRQTARLRKLKAEQEHESRYREVERAKLLAIESRFPKASETARYILTHLMSSEDCITCGNHVPAVARMLEGRINNKHCIVCGSELFESDGDGTLVELADHRFEKLQYDLTAVESELEFAQEQLQESDEAYKALSVDVAQLDAQIANRAERIETLLRKLPPEAATLNRHREELASLRGRAESMRTDLADKRRAFQQFVESEGRAMANRSEAIRSSFERYAEGFLFEGCELVWSPTQSLVGQSGTRIRFPSFELDMTSAGFPSPVRRSGPDQVSESQREFIDLAFRMALIEAVGSNGIGTLVIDAPESSLDAVFVTQAAKVFGLFADPSRGNRLVVTSNLVEGRLIPTLLDQSSDSQERPEIVNLLEIAEPTAAIRAMRDKYQEAFDRLVDGSSGELL